MRLKGKGNANRNKRERGVMIAVAALGFTAFLMAAGLAVDVSNFYAAGTELQNAADAAAMAGATSLNSTVAGLDAAVARATAVANTYSLNVSAVNIPAANVTFAANLNQFDNNGAGWNLATAKTATNFSKVRFVRVNLNPTTVNVYVARVGMGTGGTLAFTRKAIAGQSASGNTVAGTANDPGITSITNLSRLVLVEDNTGGGGTLSVAGTCANSTTYTQGCTYNINMTPPCDALSATYEVIDGNTGPAGSDLNKQMVIPLSGCYCKDTTHNANTHPQATNIRSGLNTLFNDYADSGTTLTVAGIGSNEANAFPPDANIRESSGSGAGDYSYADYKANTNVLAPTDRTGVPGRRLLVVGIMKKSTWYNPPGANGAYEYGTFQTYKYGAFFLKRRPTTAGRLQLEYIGDRITIGGGNNCTTCSSGTLTTTQTSDMSSGIAVPVLYR